MRNGRELAQNFCEGMPACQVVGQVFERNPSAAKAWGSAEHARSLTIMGCTDSHCKLVTEDRMDCHTLH
jgi:hypothetical protein